MIVDRVLAKLLEESGYPELAELSTSETLEVLPLNVLGPVKDLLAGQAHVPDAKQAIEPSLQAPMRLSEALPGPSLLDAPPPQHRSGAAEAVLNLYFEQVLERDHALLDLRPESFAMHGDALHWAPSALMTAWDPTFAQGMRKALRGLFRGSEEKYQEGMDAIGIGPASHVFRELFTFAHPKQARFEMTDLVDALKRSTDIFRTEGRRLPPFWLPFGLYTVALFRTLTRLPGPVDLTKAIPRHDASP